MLQEYATTDTPTSTESGNKNKNILLQCNDKVRTAKTFATSVRILAIRSFTSLVLFECNNAAI